MNRENLEIVPEIDKEYIEVTAPPSKWEGDYKQLSVEDFLEASPEKPLGPLHSLSHLSAFGPAVYWSLTIIVASIFNWLTESRWDLTASYQDVFLHGEYWKLWTSLWVHADAGHLLSNLWLFAVFAYLLRGFWGAAVFPFLSFSLLGGLTTALTVIHYGAGPHLLGASGMIYGMIGLWLVTYCKYEINYKLGTRIFRAIGFVLIMLFPTTITKNVSYSAHAIGFALGIVLGLLLVNFASPKQDRANTYN